MSDFQQRENTGALFRNTRKDKPSQPDYRGDLNVGGEAYELAAWLKEGKNGKFMSLSVKPKEAPPQGYTNKPDFDEDPPF